MFTIVRTCFARRLRSSFTLGLRPLRSYLSYTMSRSLHGQSSNWHATATPNATDFEQEHRGSTLCLVPSNQSVPMHMARPCAGQLEGALPAVLPAHNRECSKNTCTSYPVQHNGSKIAGLQGDAAAPRPDSQDSPPGGLSWQRFDFDAPKEDTLCWRAMSHHIQATP